MSAEVFRGRPQLGTVLVLPRQVRRFVCTFRRHSAIGLSSEGVGGGLDSEAEESALHLGSRRAVQRLFSVFITVNPLVTLGTERLVPKGAGQCCKGSTCDNGFKGCFWSLA